MNKQTNIDKRLEELLFESTNSDGFKFGAGSYVIGHSQKYWSWHTWLINEVNELSVKWLQDQLQKFVKEYQAGNKDLLKHIILYLGDIITAAQYKFSPNRKPIYNAQVDHLLNTEKFTFDQDEIFEAVNEVTIKALETYSESEGALFSTWFYRIFEKKLIDIYRRHMNERKKGYKITTWEEYEQAAKEIDFSEIGSFIPGEVFNSLTLNEKRYLALQLQFLPARLARVIQIKALGISREQLRKIRKSLQEKLLPMVTSKRPLIDDDKLTPRKWFTIHQDPTPYHALMKICHGINYDDAEPKPPRQDYLSMFKDGSRFEHDTIAAADLYLPPGGLLKCAERQRSRYIKYKLGKTGNSCLFFE
jgi:DNA-directed RNA polymerase specialized sigma24 family protein